MVNLLFLLLFCGVVLFEGGDWMPFFRMMVPAIPIFCLFYAPLTWMILKMTGLKNVKAGHYACVFINICLIIIISVSWWPVPKRFAASTEFIGTAAGKRFHAYRDLDKIINNEIILGRWIKKHAPAGLTVAVKSAGIIPYYSELKTYDCLGLTDKHIARTGLKKDRMTIPAKKNTGKGRVKAPVAMPAHEKEDFEYILNKNPDIILEGNPELLQNTGYRIFKFPEANSVYWAKSAIEWIDTENE